MFGKRLVLVDAHLLKKYRKYHKAYMNAFGPLYNPDLFAKSLNDYVECALVRDFEKLMTMIVKLKPNEMQLLAAFVSGIMVKNNLPKEDYE